MVEVVDGEGRRVGRGVGRRGPSQAGGQRSGPQAFDDPQALQGVGRVRLAARLQGLGDLRGQLQSKNGDGEVREVSEAGG